MDEEEDLLLLRIQALKSSARSKDKQRKSASGELQDDDDAESLRKIALGSLKKIKSPDADVETPSHTEQTTTAAQVDNSSGLAEAPPNNEKNPPKNFVTPTKAENDGHQSRNVEELHLRERALKSLLKKRVVKTESIIKVIYLSLFFKYFFQHAYQIKVWLLVQRAAEWTFKKQLIEKILSLSGPVCAIN